MYTLGFRWLNIPAKKYCPVAHTWTVTPTYGGPLGAVTVPLCVKPAVYSGDCSKIHVCKPAKCPLWCPLIQYHYLFKNLQKLLFLISHWKPLAGLQDPAWSSWLFQTLLPHASLCSLICGLKISLGLGAFLQNTGSPHVGARWGGTAVLLRLDLSYFSLPLPPKGLAEHPTPGRVPCYNANSSILLPSTYWIRLRFMTLSLSVSPTHWKFWEDRGVGSLPHCHPPVPGTVSISEHVQALGGPLPLRLSRLSCTPCLV